MPLIHYYRKGGNDLKQIFDYALDDNGEISIRGLKGNIELTDIVIPGQINGHPVTKIANYAFSNMKVLKTISFPKEMQKIGTAAFKNSGIESVTIRNNIRIVGSECFASCKKLSKVQWESNAPISGYCFYNCINLKDFDFSPVKYIENRAFGNSGLIKIYLGENIECVYDAAFEDCEQLQTVDWLCNCHIPMLCFSGCIRLTNFDFSNVEVVGNSSFSSSGLTNINLKPNIRKVWNGAFCHCENLIEVKWDCEADIPYACFEKCTSLKKFKASDKTINIHEYAFGGCGQLSSVTGLHVSIVFSRCFIGCSSLASLDLLSAVQIDDFAFYGCGLVRLCLGKNTKVVGLNAFESCHSLRTVEWLCEADIGKNCFLDCTRLEKVTISDKVRKIVFDAFPKCKDIDITFI